MSRSLQSDVSISPGRFRLLPLPRFSALARRGGTEVVPPSTHRLPDARRHRRGLGLLLNWVAVSFLLMVAVPVGLAIFYFGFVASPMFVSESKFAIRGAVEGLPKGPTLEMFTPLTALNSSQDAHIVSSYIESGPLVQAMQRELDIRRIYGRTDADPLSRLDPDTSLEKVRQYWTKHVRATIDNLSGVITLRVSAFTPEDALSISRSVIKASELLVNEMSTRKNEDAANYALEEVKRAEKRIQAALMAMQDFRNKSGLLDPVKEAEATLKIATALRAERITLENELAAARRTLSENAPSVQVLTTRLNGIKAQLQVVERSITSESRDEKTASGALFRYETLELERVFAEKVYVMTQAAYERARASADRQQLYLTTFVQPSLAEMPTLPRRGSEILVVMVCSLGIWSVFALLTASVRDHAA